MNRINYWVLCVVATYTFISCNSGEIEKLEARIAELEQELDHCQNGESVIIGTMKNALLDGNKNEYVSLYEKLKDEFPGSDYLAEAKIKVNEIEEGIKELKRIEEELLAKDLEKKKKNLKNLKSEFDDVSGVTWYHQPYYTHYNNSNRLSFYIGKQKNKMPFLRLKMSYSGEDWIFFDKAYISVKGNTREISFNKYKEKKSDNSGGKVWEWIDVPVDDLDSQWAYTLSAYPETKMRLSGKYTETRTLTANERKGIEDILNAYWFLRENPDVD